MKKNLIASAVLGLAMMANATLYNYTFTPNTTIPDGNPVGVANSQTVDLGILPSGTTTQIENVDVHLNISGGYNGDLYGYLVLQSADNSTTTTILLNRIGQDLSTPFGSSGSGINVTLSSSGATDIHTAAGTLSGGTYYTDGSQTALNAFNGVNANGTWTLYLADLSGGDTATLVSWGLDITVVPEPITWALIAFALAGSGMLIYRHTTARI